MDVQSVSPEIVVRNEQLQNIECRRLSPSLQDDENATFENLGSPSDSFLAGIPSEKNGFYVLFLPPIGDDLGVYNIDKKPNSEKSGTSHPSGWHPKKWPEPNHKRIKILIEQYGIPKWFFKNIGWNANGFCGSSVRPEKDDLQQGYDVYARFLSKEVEARGNQIEYGWTYMSFYLISLTSKHTHSSEIDSLVILLCFDIPKRLCGSIMDVLQGQRVRSLLMDSPFAVLPPVLFNVVMVEFERGLWTFQAPVRSIEKRREAVLASPQGHGSDQSKVAQMERNYRDIYELLRHALHVTESIDVASKALQAAYDETRDLLQTWSELSGIQPDKRTVHQSLRTLRFSSNLASSLDQRADAFVDRLRNEAKIVSSLASTRLLNQTIKDGQDEAKSDRELLEKIQILLEQTKNAGVKFAERISVLTLSFLPGTLMAGIFGMNFFSMGDKNKLNVSKEIYLFFVFTVPITMLCLWWLSRAEPIAPEDSSKTAEGLNSLRTSLSFVKRLLFGRPVTHSDSPSDVRASSVSVEMEEITTNGPEGPTAAN